MFIVLFLVSIIMPNYAFRNSLSYSYKVSVGNVSICCVNDRHTCFDIMNFINRSIKKLKSKLQINIVIYKDFESYMANNKTTCNIIIGLNEFEYIIAKSRGKIKHIDYFATYRFLEKTPHEDLLLRTLILAIPYCYTLNQLNNISYVNLTTILSKHIENNTFRLLPVKIYRLIVISYTNDIVEEVLGFLLGNNSRLYNGKYCNSVFYKQKIKTINDIVSYYDIQRIIATLGGKH